MTPEQARRCVTEIEAFFWIARRRALTDDEERHLIYLSHRLSLIADAELSVRVAEFEPVEFTRPPLPPQSW